MYILNIVKQAVSGQVQVVSFHLSAHPKNCSTYECAYRKMFLERKRNTNMEGSVAYSCLLFTYVFSHTLGVLSMKDLAGKYFLGQVWYDQLPVVEYTILSWGIITKYLYPVACK